MGKHLVGVVLRVEQSAVRKAKNEGYWQKIRQNKTLKKINKEDLFKEQEDQDYPSYSAGQK